MIVEGLWRLFKREIREPGRTAPYMLGQKLATEAINIYEEKWTISSYKELENWVTEKIGEWTEPSGRDYKAFQTIQRYGTGWDTLFWAAVNDTIKEKLGMG